MKMLSPYNKGWRLVRFFSIEPGDRDGNFKTADIGLDFVGFGQEFFGISRFLAKIVMSGVSRAKWPFGDFFSHSEPFPK